MGSAKSPSPVHSKEEVTNIIAIGLDLAKNVFAVHGIDEAGKAVLIKPTVKRDALLQMIAKLPPCLIDMEACSGAHHWARQFHAFGKEHIGSKAKMLSAEDFT
jgi:hypothetical protein